MTWREWVKRTLWTLWTLWNLLVSTFTFKEEDCYGLLQFGHEYDRTRSGVSYLSWVPCALGVHPRLKLEKFVYAMSLIWEKKISNANTLFQVRRDYHVNNWIIIMRVRMQIRASYACWNPRLFFARRTGTQKLKLVITRRWYIEIRWKSWVRVDFAKDNKSYRQICRPSTPAMRKRWQAG